MTVKQIGRNTRWLRETDWLFRSRSRELAVTKVYGHSRKVVRKSMKGTQK
jgi:hypothetical protein